VAVAGRARHLARLSGPRGSGGVALSILVLAGPLLGVLAYGWGVRYEREGAEARFGEHLNESARRLQQELHSLAEELYRARSLFAVEDAVSRAGFRVFTERALSMRPALRAFEWAPRVTDDRRQAFERAARRNGSPRWRISVAERGGVGGLVPAPTKGEYFPVLYAEPIATNEGAIGFDLSSEPSRRAALDAARQTQGLGVTPPVDLVQEPRPSKALLFVLPVLGPATTSGRGARSSLHGFLVLVVRVPELLAPALPQRPPGGSSRLHYRLIDEGAGAGEMLIAASPDWAAASADGPVSWVRGIEIGSRRWALAGRPTERFFAERRSRQPIALGLATLLAWETLVGLLLVSIRRTRDAADRERDRIVGAALGSLSEGVVVADPQGRFLLFNEAARRMVGMGSTDTGPTSWPDVYGCFLPDGVTPCPADQLPLVLAIRGERTDDAEMLVRNPRVPEGVRLSVSGMPLRDEGGVLVGGVITYRDVTARRKAEDALRKSLHRLEELRYAVDQAAIVTVANQKGLIVYVNDRFCETSGFSREELMGRDCRIVDSGHHPREFFEEVGRTVASGSVWKGLVCGRAKSGTHFWLATTIVPLREESGRPRRYMAISTEVTESLRQAETLRRLSNAVEQTADSVFITDREGVIEYVNPAFEATTGYSREEALGKTPRILKSGRHDRAHYEELWKTILAGEVHRSTGVNRKKSGELYCSEQTITPMRDGEGRITHFVAVVKDVTDRIDRQAREIEMEYAARVQRRLYPERPPEIDGLDLAGSVFPAVKVGGDYFDFVTLPGGGLLVAVGDVCGHGLGSALIMAETRAYLRSLAPSCADPAMIVSQLNPVLGEHFEGGGQYVTLLLARIEVADRRLTYASAGHTPGYVLDRSGAVTAVLESTALPLGMFADARPGSSVDVALRAGDLFVLLTDGITEAESPDGTTFEAERALEVVRAHRHQPARDIVGHLREAILAFSGGAPARDDLTVVVGKLAL
jgi:sigma-B regulation protein RsbU (phosphoserine phosphatase)